MTHDSERSRGSGHILHHFSTLVHSWLHGRFVKTQVGTENFQKSSITYFYFIVRSEINNGLSASPTVYYKMDDCVGNNDAKRKPFFQYFCFQIVRI